MLLITLFLARESQRRKLVHNSNLLSLVLGFIRAILQVIYFSSHGEEFYYFSTNDTSDKKRPMQCFEGQCVFESLPLP